MIYAKIVSDLDQHIYDLDLKKANKAIKFIENFVHHSEGRNDHLKLELWQKAFISVIFGCVDSDGNRHYREVLLVIARKNGKTLLASAIAAYMIYLDGEYGAKVFCVAPKLQQAELVYSDIWQTIQAEKELEELTKHRKSDIYIESTNSSIQKIAFSEKKSDGLNPSLAICDEIAAWPGDKGLKQYEVLKSAQGARSQPIILSISTSGYENEGIYDELIKRATRFLLGDSKETRLAPFLYMIDDIQKWNDINELKKANPNLGVSISTDYLLEEIRIAEDSLSKKAEFLTKYCNIKQNSSQAWLSAQDVTKTCGNKLKFEDFSRCYCVGGIDLSRTTDLTACVAVVEKEGILHVFAKFFMPKELIDEATARDGLPYRIFIQKGFLMESGENYVDYHDCYNWFKDLIEKYRMYPLQVGYDRYTAQYLVKDMETYGFHMDDVFQGENLTPVIQELEGMIKDGKIDIGDNDLLKVHLLNSALKTNSENERRRLIKLSTYQHVDGMAALLDAITVRQKHYKGIGNQLLNLPRRE